MRRSLRRRSLLRTPIKLLARADLPRGRASAFCLRIRLAHIGAGLGLSVIRIAVAVINVIPGIQPDQPRSAAGSSRLRRSCLRRTQLLPRSGRSWCGRRSRRRRRSRCSRRLAGSRGRCRCRSRSSLRRSWCSSSRCRRIPRLHPLMATARPSLRSSRRIRAILANSGRTRRSARGRLRHRSPRTHQHQTRQSQHFAGHRSPQVLQIRNITATQS